MTEQNEQTVFTAEELAMEADTGSIEVFTKTGAGLAAMREQYGEDKIPAGSTPEEYEVIKAACKTFSSTRTSLDAAKKTLKAPFLEKADLIEQEYKRVHGEVSTLEAPWKAKKKKIDDAEKERKAQFEARLEEKISAIKAFADRADQTNSDGIAELMDELHALDTRDFYHREKEALDLKVAMMDKLQDKFSQRVDFEHAEKERQRLEAERIEREAAQRVDNEIAKYGSMVGNFMDSDADGLKHQIWVLENSDLPDVGERNGELVAARDKALAGLKKLLAMLPEDEPTPEPEQFGNPGEHIRAEEAAAARSVNTEWPDAGLVAKAATHRKKVRAAEPEEYKSIEVHPDRFSAVVSLLMDQFEVTLVRDDFNNTDRVFVK